MPAFEEDTTSIAGVIRGLDIGQTFSRTIRLAVGDKKADVTDTLSNLRNSMNQAVSKIRKTTKRTFRVESAPALTDDKQAILCTVAVTRLEGGEDEEEVDI